VVFKKVIKHFEDILFWTGTLIRMTAMIKLRHQQPSLWHRGLAEDIAELWEPWMRLVDELLEDEQLLDTVYEAQGERYPQSRIRGRIQTPAEVLLRLLLLKHVRNWSYDVLEREVRANLVYRAFTRIGDEKVPDAKTLARLGQLIGPKVIEELHRRVVELAQERGVTQGRKLRVDTTVVESNIHYPTDSSLLGDGTRVLTRTMKKIESKAGGLKRKVRDRMRSIRKRVLAIALSTRLLGPSGRKAEKAAVWGTAQLDAKSDESGEASTGGSEAGTAASPHSAGRSGAIAGDHGGAGWASGETDADSDFRRRHEVAGKDRERVRTAHGNHTQRESEQAQRVWQAGQDSGSGEPNRDPL
jgi:IS5 family transposase